MRPARYEMFIDQTRMLNNLCVLFFWSLNDDDDDDWNSYNIRGEWKKFKTSSESTSFQIFFLHFFFFAGLHY